MCTPMVSLPSGALLSPGAPNQRGKGGDFREHGDVYENSAPKLEISG